MYALLTIVAALAFAVGGVFMKLADGLHQPGPTVALYLCFSLGATCQTVAMRQGEMGVAYVLVLGLEALLAFSFGLLFFRETQSLPKLAGVAAIAAGIILLHLPTGQA